jgi:uncharacterized phage-associated protein
MSDAGHDARAVANYFIRKAKEQGIRLSITQLVKLVYLAHGWHLGLYGKPLSRHGVEAWKFGPVIPVVYNAFRGQGVYVEKEFPLPAAEQIFSEEEKSVMDDVLRMYGCHSPFQLTRITHRRGAPWDTVRAFGYFAPIPDNIIRAYYRDLAARHQKPQ